jgi:hypothetical protein
MRKTALAAPRRRPAMTRAVGDAGCSKGRSGLFVKVKEHLLSADGGGSERARF